MKIFEFHFNPKLKKDLVFDSFCYEPEKAYEKKLGNLYIIGLLNNILPQNQRLIKRLAEVIKNKYYSSKTNSAERALKGSLKEANNFLDKISKSGDVSWLGNLDFFILSIKDSYLNFAKVGDIKPFLIRSGQITDIDEKVLLDELEPYPLKVFANIISGKLTESDLIIILTKELFNFFKKENILKMIARLNDFDNKQLNEILNHRKQTLNSISGVLLAIQFIKKTSLGKKQIISRNDLEKFSLKKIFTPVLKIFGNLSKPFNIRIKTGKKKIKGFSFKIPQIKLKAPEIKIKLLKETRPLPKLPTIKKAKKLLFDKNIILVLSLGLLLIFGFAFSKFEQNKKIRIYTEELKQIQEKLQLSESFLILKDTNPEAFEKANLLLKESWSKILPLTKGLSLLPKDFSSQILSLKDEISSKLLDLNRLEEIENPELFFEFNRKEFIPHNLLFNNNDLYFFTPYSKNIFILEKNKERKIIESEQTINLAAQFGDSVLFFSKPDKIIILKNNDVLESQLQIPYQDFNFSGLASVYNNLYFLNKKTGQIIKYGFLHDFKWKTPVSWLNQKEEGVIKAKSISLDSSVWVLKNSSIYKYYKGEFQKEIQFKIFPEVKDFSKIYTSTKLPYLYILEPIQKRIIILNKDGQIIKQFQSEKFDNLLDFAVSENGKIIYLLNGLKVYIIKL